MPHVDVKTSYQLQLTPEEFRLVGLALAGKLKPGSSEAEAAIALNVAIMGQRSKQLSLAAEVATAASKSAGASSD